MIICLDIAQIVEGESSTELMLDVLNSFVRDELSKAEKQKANSIDDYQRNFYGGEIFALRVVKSKIEKMVEKDKLK